MTISSDVVILTRAEYRACTDREFQRGIARGRFEQNHDNQSNTPEAGQVRVASPPAPSRDSESPGDEPVAVGASPRFHLEDWIFKDEGGGVVMVTAPSGQCCGIGYMPQGSATASNILRDLVIAILIASAPAPIAAAPLQTR